MLTKQALYYMDIVEALSILTWPVEKNSTLKAVA